MSTFYHSKEGSTECYRNFGFIAWEDSMPEGALECLLNNEQLSVAISPRHGPDEDAPGKYHYHGVLMFGGKHCFNEVDEYLRRVTGCSQIEPIADLPQAIRYLIHKGWKDKKQYPFEGIRATTDIRKYFLEKTFVIDILQIIEEQQPINSYKTLVSWLAKHNKFSELEIVAARPYFFKQYFDIGYISDKDADSVREQIKKIRSEE